MSTTFERFVEFIRDDTGRTPRLVWAICPRCDGDGTLGGFAGAYTESDRAEWSYEDYEDYANTRRHCDECNGTGKVQELPEESPVADAWAEWLRDEAEDRATRRAESGYSW